MTLRVETPKRLFGVITAVVIMMTSGCATSFVRSKSTVDPQHVFPATVFDAKFFWEAGVKGEPLLATTDPEARRNPLTRFACILGAIIDTPFSIVFDTLLLPVDLSRTGSRSEERDTEGGPGADANRDSGAVGCLRRICSLDR